MPRNIVPRHRSRVGVTNINFSRHGLSNFPPVPTTLQRLTFDLSAWVPCLNSFRSIVRIEKYSIAVIKISSSEKRREVNVSPLYEDFLLMILFSG